MNNFESLYNRLMEDISYASNALGTAPEIGTSGGAFPADNSNPYGKNSGAIIPKILGLGEIQTRSTPIKPSKKNKKKK